MNSITKVMRPVIRGAKSSCESKFVLYMMWQKVSGTLASLCVDISQWHNINDRKVKVISKVSKAQLPITLHTPKSIGFFRGPHISDLNNFKALAIIVFAEM